MGSNQKGAAKVYDAAKNAWTQGYWAFIKWLASNLAAMDIIYSALKAAGLIN